jgi:hypothetical protein
MDNLWKVCLTMRVIAGRTAKAVIASIHVEPGHISQFLDIFKSNDPFYGNGQTHLVAVYGVHL